MQAPEMLLIWLSLAVNLVPGDHGGLESNSPICSPFQGQAWGQRALTCSGLELLGCRSALEEGLRNQKPFS